MVPRRLVPFAKNPSGGWPVFQGRHRRRKRERDREDDAACSFSLSLSFLPRGRRLRHAAPDLTHVSLGYLTRGCDIGLSDHADEFSVGRDWNPTDLSALHGRHHRLAVIVFPHPFQPRAGTGG